MKVIIPLLGLLLMLSCNQHKAEIGQNLQTEVTKTGNIEENPPENIIEYDQSVDIKSFLKSTTNSSYGRFFVDFITKVKDEFGDISIALSPGGIRELSFSQDLSKAKLKFGFLDETENYECAFENSNLLLTNTKTKKIKKYSLTLRDEYILAIEENAHIIESVGGERTDRKGEVGFLIYSTPHLNSAKDIFDKTDKVNIIEGIK